MVHGGLALARLPGGRVVLVRGGIPGEVIEGDLYEASGVLRADVAEVSEPSPDRVAPPEHPGLDYGHIAYPRQLELKREVVADALKRATSGSADLKEIGPITASPRIWGYRSAVQPAVSGGGLGYRLPASDRVVRLEEDPVANRAIREAWKEVSTRGLPKGVREVAFRGNDAGEVLLALVATSPQRTLLPFAHELVRAGIHGVSYARYDARGRFRGGSSRLAGARRIVQEYGRFRVSVSVTSFAQPNPAAATRLYERLAEVAGSGANAVELFAGSGVIAFHLAGGFERVTAVEIDRGSVERGTADAARAGIDNIAFVRADARETPLGDDVDLVAVDPPRAGLARPLREAISGSGAGRLLYVSCDPATWARDVAHFLELGWRLELAEPFDFYPHTHHVEVLSLLSR